MRKGFVFILLALQLMACRDKIICPAFQSTYILDDSTRMAYYSYVWKLDEDTRTQFLASASGQSDSLNAGSSANTMIRYYDYVADVIQPRETVRRSKYGIIKYEPMWLKNYKLKTAPKENVLGPEPDKAKTVSPDPITTGDFLASDFTDSLATDSTMFIARDSAQVAKVEVKKPIKAAKKEDKYLYRYDPDTLNNVEQEYYNKYYGELLVDYSEQRRKARAKAIEESQLKADIDSMAINGADSTSIQGGFKGRLKKKKKDEPLQQEEAIQQQEEEGQEEGDDGFR